MNSCAAWREACDPFEPARVRLGATGHAVYRAIDDGNDVTAWHRFDNPAAAKTFVNSEELKTAMMGAGVIGTPSIWFTHHARSQRRDYPRNPRRPA